MAKLAQELRAAVLQAAIEGILTNSPEKADREEGKPFGIPKTWRWEAAADVGKMVRGSGIKRGEVTEEGFPCVRYGQLYTTYKGNFKKAISCIPKEIFDKSKHAKAGDILMSLTGENEYDIALARAYLGEEVIAYGGDMTCWTDHQQVPEYLVSVMNSPYGIGQKSKMATGKIIVHISNSKIGTIQLPLPPIEEQQRIVDRVDELMAKIDEFEAIENELEDLKTAFPGEMKEALLQAAMEGTLDSNVNTDSWKVVRLGDMGEFKGGQTPKNNMLADTGIIPYYKVSDMNTEGNEKEMVIAKAWLNKSYKGKTFPKGSIIYPKNGGAVFTNKKRILIEESLVDLNTGVFIPIGGLDLDYVYYAFMRVDFRQYYKGTALPTVDTAKVKQIEYLLPPIEEQQRIVDRLDALLPLCDSLEELN